MRSMRAASRAAFILILVALAGCTPVRWQKPGADPDISTRDLDACRQQARTLSYQEMSTRVVVQPYGLMDRAITPPVAAEGDRVAMEQHFLQMCMRGKGYELKPVESDARR